MPVDRRRFIANTALLGLGSLAAQPLQAAMQMPPGQLATSAMISDLTLLRQAYGLLHPGLTRYLPVGGFDKLVDDAIRFSARPRAANEFFVTLSKLTAAVRCGHSYVNPFNQSRTVAKDLLGRADRLPFCAAWIGGRMVITDGLDTGLPRGTIIQSIDGISTSKMLRDMLPLTRTDGNNQAKQIAQLELRRGDRFAAFDLFRAMLYAPQAEGSAAIVAEVPRVGTRTIEIPLVPEGGRGSSFSADPTSGWRFSIDSAGLGLLTMPTWAMYNKQWDWRGFLNSCADELVSTRARGLVIDLRDNEGGLDCGDALLARLIDRPIRDAEVRRLVRFQKTAEALRPFLDTWDPSFQALGEGAAAVVDRPGYFDLGATDARLVEPVGPRFVAPVAVLVSGVCSSATFEFVKRVMKAGAGTIVGTPTGGNLRGINGGSYFFLRLPETGFEVDLPLIGYFPIAPQPDSGINPDILARRTIRSVIAGYDVALNAAKRRLL